MKGTKILLAISGVLAVGISAALLFSAQTFLASQGIPADAKVAVVGQAQGSLLFAIGVLNLLALRTRDVRGLQAVCGGNIASHVAALGVNVAALSKGLVGQSVMGDAIGHVIFALAFAACVVVLARHHEPT